MAHLTRRNLATSLLAGIGAFLAADHASAGALIFEPPAEPVVITEPKRSATKAQQSPRAVLRQRGARESKADKSPGRWVDSNDMGPLIFR